MENSSKALLIAGGALITIMIVTLIVIGYNSITEYQRSKQFSMTQEQLDAFNKEYEAYERDDVTGFELVSLLNKILDYNNQNTVSSDNNDWENDSSDRSYTEMFVKFTITDPEITDLFGGKDTIDSEKRESKKTIEKVMGDMQALESKYGSGVMSKLAGMTDYNKKTAEGLKDIQYTLNGENPKLASADPNDLPDNDEVKKYQNYINFKRGSFRCIDQETEYDRKNGRIIKLVFEQN